MMITQRVKTEIDNFGDGHVCYSVGRLKATPKKSGRDVNR